DATHDIADRHVARSGREVDVVVRRNGNTNDYPHASSSPEERESSVSIQARGDFDVVSPLVGGELMSGQLLAGAATPFGADREGSCIPPCHDDVARVQIEVQRAATGYLELLLDNVRYPLTLLPLHRPRQKRKHCNYGQGLDHRLTPAFSGVCSLRLRVIACE